MKIKRITLIIALAVLAVALLLGLMFMKINNDRREAEAAAAAMDAVIISHDRTVIPDFIYNYDSINSDTLLEHFTLPGESFEEQSPEELAELSSDVIMGQVLSINYTFIEGMAWTQADISLSRVFSGPLIAGNVISVYFPGGYASVQDYNEFNSLSSPGDDNSYYSFTVGKAPVPVQGDDVLLFLKPASGKGIPEGAYCLSCGEYSVFGVYNEGEGVHRGDDDYMELSRIEALFPPQE